MEKSIMATATEGGYSALFAAFLNESIGHIIPWMVRSVLYSVLDDGWDCEKRSAYKDISMEREARFSEKDPHYLENSGYFAWLKEI